MTNLRKYVADNNTNKDKSRHAPIIVDNYILSRYSNDPKQTRNNTKKNLQLMDLSTTHLCNIMSYK